MDDYGAVLWLPVCAGLTGLGILLSILVWRRRGAASGLRLVSWSLLPIGLYLVGLLEIVVPFGVKLVTWLIGGVFQLMNWIGFVVLGLAVLLWVISGVMIGRRNAAADSAGAGAEKDVESGKAKQDKQVTASNGSSEQAGLGNDLGDIEDILKRRGIE